MIIRKGSENMAYRDYMVRGITENEEVRAFAVTSRDTVEKARKAHGTMNVATAALGRTLTAGLLMNHMLKNEDDLLTIQFRGDGPLGGITVTADSTGGVKGYVNNPYVLLPLKENGHLDVGSAVGKGTLTVIRDLNLRETHSGTIAIQTGEIAEDLTMYFAESEQVPSSIGLGVMVSPSDHHVIQSGGFMIQLMPDASEETIRRIEENLTGLRDVTEMLSEGMTPEQMLETVLGGLGVRIIGTMPVAFRCGCSRERVHKVLRMLGKDELDDMIREKKPAELVCHFCGTQYAVSISELEEIRASLGDNA